MRPTERELRRYFRRISRLLPCSRRQKREILGQLRCNVERYREFHPQADFGQIRAEFGAPEDIAAACVESAGTAEILQALWIRKKLVAWVAGTLAAGLLLWAATVTWAIVENRTLVNGRLEVVTVEELP